MHFPKLVLSSAAAVLLTGCTIVPGSDMNRFNSVWFNDTPEEYTPAETDIDYIPINATVVSNLKYRQSGTATANGELEEAIDNYKYRVGPGDVLTITVWEHPELTIPAGSFRTAAEGGNEIKADGTVFYPYAGNLAVAGLTTNQIKVLIQNRLTSVIKNPQVDVRVADFKSQRVYVSGAVLKPGIAPITNVPLTLVEAIEQMGGLAPDAAWNSVQLTRNGSTRTISLRSLYEEGKWTENLLLSNGDLVHVMRNDAEKVFVLGEVNRPMSLMMSRNGTSLAEALATANGINENKADARGIYVLRNTGVKRGANGEPVYSATVFHLNAASAVGFMLADQFPLEPRDVVYVSPAPITKWNRFMSQLVPTILATENIGDIENN